MSNNRQEKSALLQAINDAAAGINKNSISKHSEVVGKSGVNQRVANDLISTTSSKVNMRDFESNGFQHKKTLIGRVGSESKKQDDDLRSVRSEFDYSNKKKFTDVLSQSRHRFNLKMEPKQGELSLKSSVFSKKSLASRASRASAAVAPVPQNAEEQVITQAEPEIEEN